MKVLLYYFTGTYNTLFITTILKNVLLLKNYQVEVRSFNDEDKKANINADIIGIAYPIYHHITLKSIEKAIKKINIKNKKYFIYHTGKKNSSLNEISSYKINKIMLKNKNVFCGQYHFLMPSNYKEKTNEEMINYEINYAIKQVKYIVNHLEEEKKYHITLRQKIAYYFSKITRVKFHLNALFVKVNKDKCNRCKKCTYQCVNKSLHYNKNKRKIVCKTSCVGCFLCIYLCHNDAISFGFLNSKKVIKYYDFNTLLANYKKEIKIDYSLLNDLEAKYFIDIDKLNQY